KRRQEFQHRNSPLSQPLVRSLLVAGPQNRAGRSRRFRVAHASRMLVSASRQTVLAGERGLPACNRRQLADDVVFGKLPALPRMIAPHCFAKSRALRARLPGNETRHSAGVAGFLHQSEYAFPKAYPIRYSKLTTHITAT